MAQRSPLDAPEADCDVVVANGALLGQLRVLLTVPHLVLHPCSAIAGGDFRWKSSFAGYEYRVAAPSAPGDAQDAGLAAAESPEFGLSARRGEAWDGAHTAWPPSTPPQGRHVKQRACVGSPSPLGSLATPLDANSSPSLVVCPRQPTSARHGCTPSYRSDV